ncbi:hypothetical protein SAY87_014156 [Trapa incisa]|uniref:Transcription factor IIIB 90 kDa subunit n=1 Tax=Trapa incisa TaxID=236973 RepID=A0AAN7GW73_9MYRT|nr:hypothetical protein SAY87_014156 [Trapa incisa]
MVQKWCSHCAKMVLAERPFDGSLCCSECGRVLEDFNFSETTTFVKDAAGQSHLSGIRVRTVQGDGSASRERTLENAYEGMKNLCYGLGMDQPEGILREASAFYRMALEKNFTRGRRSELVQAACIYIACRESKLPYLLIDFSNWLKINVYVLGAVFLQLCKVLWLEEHQIVQKPIDPSLFIHKYTTCLSGGRNNEVARTALRIIANMRRDWMQTGRKPSGLWGAAVYVSALAHGLSCSKYDILRLVHVCEATLTKRLIEFENTKSGSLTIEELNAKAMDEERAPAVETNIDVDICPRELLCEHKGTEIPHYKIGLCKSCYNEFVEFSGGLEGEADPPAFQRAERERAILASLEKERNSNLHENGSSRVTSEKMQAGTEESGVHTGSNGTAEAKDRNAVAGDESDTLSDIDDVEVDCYLHNEEEKHNKKILWELQNREYLEEQAAKEAAAAAARKAFAANFKGTSEELAAQELAAATKAAVANARKAKQRKRAAEAKNAAPAQTAAEATRQILEKKRLSSKINYEELEKLFAQNEAPENFKKQKTESLNNGEDKPHKGGRKLESEETPGRNQGSELKPDDENNEEEGEAEGEEYEYGQFYGYANEALDYEGEDYGYNGF